jgi:diphosphomevalonate decarboxylase
VRTFRKKYGIPVCFTLDASPNIYVLYPNQYRKVVLNFIREKLLPNCEEKKWFDDKVGSGPKIINRN